MRHKWQSWLSWASATSPKTTFRPYQSHQTLRGTFSRRFSSNYQARPSYPLDFLQQWLSWFRFSILSSWFISTFLKLSQRGPFVVIFVRVWCLVGSFPSSGMVRTVPSVCPSRWCNLCGTCIRLLWKSWSSQYKWGRRVCIFPLRAYRIVSFSKWRRNIRKQKWPFFPCWDVIIIF